MRLTIVITSPNTEVNIPKHPKNGQEWKKFQVCKCYHNVNANNTGINKALFLTFDECENNGYFETSSGKVIKYDYTFLVTQDGSVDEIRLYDDRYDIYFDKTRTDKLTINIVNVNGDEPTASDLGTARYMILEINLE